MQSTILIIGIVLLVLGIIGVAFSFYTTWMWVLAIIGIIVIIWGWLAGSKMASQIFQKSLIIKDSILTNMFKPVTLTLIVLSLVHGFFTNSPIPSQQYCVSSSDCPQEYVCNVSGALIFGQPVNKICTALPQAPQTDTSSSLSELQVAH